MAKIYYCVIIEKNEGGKLIVNFWKNQKIVCNFIVVVVLMLTTSAFADQINFKYDNGQYLKAEMILDIPSGFTSGELGESSILALTLSSEYLGISNLSLIEQFAYTPFVVIDNTSGVMKITEWYLPGNEMTYPALGTVNSDRIQYHMDYGYDRINGQWVYLAQDNTGKVFEVVGNTTTVPEPGTVSLVVLGVFMLALVRRRVTDFFLKKLG